MEVGGNSHSIRLTRAGNSAQSSFYDLSSYSAVSQKTIVYNVLEPSYYTLLNIVEPS